MDTGQDPESVKVHITNPGDMVVRTEEREPEHFVLATITLQTPAQLAAQGQGPQLILAEDPLRKDAALYPADAAIVICHSPQQAASAGNQVAGFIAPDGAYVSQGQSVTLTGTGRVYAACQVATRVSIIVNRRGS
jgi:hypothetical protein